MDARGYGRSTRPPEAPPPFVRSPAVVRDVATVVDWIRGRRRVEQVALPGWATQTIRTLTAWILDLILVRSEVVEPAPLERRVCSDPDHDKFVACAAASGANVAVSGDRHPCARSSLGKLAPRHGVRWPAARGASAAL